jgi:hypothetical protein
VIFSQAAEFLQLNRIEYFVFPISLFAHVEKQADKRQNCVYLGSSLTQTSC